MKAIAVLITILLTGSIFYYMGLLDRLFGKKNDNGVELKAEQSDRKQDWDFYMSLVDGEIGSIYVDLAVKEIGPISNQESVVTASVKMNQPRPDGMSSQEESEQLFKIEDALLAGLSNVEFTYVGRLTSQNNRDFYFYTNSVDGVKESVETSMKEFPNYEFQLYDKHDPDWEGYFDFLYPLPNQFQSIQNRRVLDHLSSEGDPLTKPRDVFHWVYFKSSTDRQEYIEVTAAKGFNVVSANDDVGGEFPFQLQLSRFDKVDYESLNEYTLELWELAPKHNGVYDGWETSLEKE